MGSWSEAGGSQNPGVYASVGWKTIYQSYEQQQPQKKLAVSQTDPYAKGRVTLPSVYKQGTTKRQVTETGGSDDIIDITPNSHQRNPPPLGVQDYVAQHVGYLDAERFEVIAMGLHCVSAYLEETGRLGRS